MAKGCYNERPLIEMGNTITAGLIFSTPMDKLWSDASYSEDPL